MFVTETQTPETLYAEAAAADQAAYDSFERCDTDGFLTQWASGLTAQEKRAQARIAEAGGVAEFPALFTLAGEPVPARLVSTRYGTKFAVFASAADAAEYGAPVVAWVNPFVKPAFLAKKGYKVQQVLAPAKATLRGSGTGLAGATSVHVVVVRTDGGFDPAAPVVA
jgi:hypothetical protein